LVIVLLLIGRVQAQGGIRGIFSNLEPITTGFNGDGSHYGIGYDHDVSDRLSMAITVRRSTGVPSTVVNYRSAYHFSDNEGSSYYMGSMVGLRSFGSEGPGLQFPVGFRFGARGGLEGFFADLYVGGHYNLGASGEVTDTYEGVTSDLRKWGFSVGLDVGWGWAGGSGRRR
jgi:hypothetical protein